METQQGTAAGLEVEEAVRYLEHGSPDFEGGVDLEGVGAIVLKYGQERSGVHQEGGVAAGLERLLGPTRDLLQVHGEQGIERGRLRNAANVGHAGRSGREIHRL